MRRGTSVSLLRLLATTCSSMWMCLVFPYMCRNMTLFSSCSHTTWKLSALKTWKAWLFSPRSLCFVRVNKQHNTEEGHEDQQRAGEPIWWRETEGIGVFSPSGEKEGSAGVLKRQAQRGWRFSLQKEPRGEGKKQQVNGAAGDISSWYKKGKF